MLNSRGELVTNETEKAKVLNTFSSSVFTSTVGLQALGTKPQADAHMNPVGKSLFVICDSSLTSSD